MKAKPLPGYTGGYAFDTITRSSCSGTGGCPAAVRRWAARERQPAEEDRVLAQTGLVDPALVVAWNQTINDIGFATLRRSSSPLRAHAMMHIAMHDALNAVVPLYRQYTYRSHDPGAHAIAAAAQAAYQVGISAVSGSAGEAGGGACALAVEDSGYATQGAGHCSRPESAAAILALRVNDGWDYQGTYTFSNEPGAYQTTPPWNGFILQPGFRYAKPFGLRSPDQFRPGPPPRLESAQYAAAFNEVKDFGRVNSVVRTQEQTLYAVWWLEFAETSVNRLARELATQRRTHLWQASRMFALLNMSLYDGYVAVFDSKYEYNHWRPYTAIRQAALDGNPATAADPTGSPSDRPHPFRNTCPATPPQLRQLWTSCRARLETTCRSR